MQKIDIIAMFAEEGYQVSPDAVEVISAHDSPIQLVGHILATIDESVFVVEAKHIDFDSFSLNTDQENLHSDINLNLSLNPNSSSISSSPNFETVSSASEMLTHAESLPSSIPSFPSSSTSRLLNDCKSKSKFNSNCRYAESPVDIISDITDQSTCVGEYMEFVQYFRNRYSKLSEMIRGRVSARPIESLVKNRRKGGGMRQERGEGGYNEISIIGMVSDIKTTTNGHKILELEDPTGSFSVLVRMADKDLFEEASCLVLDEVVGVTGALTNDGNLMIVKKIIMPDLPAMPHRKSTTSGKVVFISDVHIGSSTFLKDAWHRFIDFLNGDVDNEDMRKISGEVRYLVVAGDLVDGVGIFPGQDKELEIYDVYDQYKKAVEYFDQIPSHIKIIIGPGNHDAVRQAEPQPRFPDHIRSHFNYNGNGDNGRNGNITFVGNPAMVNLDGVKVLMYHGRSIDDLVAAIPGVSYQDPTTAMVEMMKRRHLSPIYGSRVSIAPEKQDHFVINQIPDILHCGHVHTVGIKNYKNVLLINSGTWQAQTDFQKRVNLMPTPALIPVVDLSNMKTTMLSFSDDDN
ncbi:MAG: DNA-directed DNA polymerase II small subunit [Methanosarcinaceae archaeon]|nr:DNA-directed DNA polymerase II small subunit [Methanosarcinaceae archaeon]